eukprot:tig00020553_g10783.t1
MSRPFIASQASNGSVSAPLALPTERAEAALAAGQVDLPPPLCAGVIDLENDAESVGGDEAEDPEPAEPEAEAEELDDEARLVDRLNSNECAWRVELRRNGSASTYAARREVVVSDCAWRQWRAKKGVEPVLRRDVLRKLIRIASGQRGARLSKRIALPQAPQPQLFESYLCARGWRALWEEVVGVSGRDGVVRDQILLWGVFGHDRTEARIRYIEEKIQGRPPLELRPAPRPAGPGGARLPREFAGDLPPSAPGRRYLVAASLYPDEAPSAAGTGDGSGGERRGRDREADQQTLAEVRAEAAAVALLPLAGGADFPNEIAARSSGAPWAPPGPASSTGGPAPARPPAPPSGCGRGTGPTGAARAGRGCSRGRALPFGLPRGECGALPRAAAEGASMRAVVTRDAAAAADEEVDGMGADDDALAAAAAASLAELDEAAFPLFVTRDRFLRMLNGALDRPFDLAGEGERLVTAARFQAELWPELCTAGRDELRAIGSDAAWLEIVSHIRTMSSERLSDGSELGRMQSTLGEGQRRAVYALHARYEQLKRSPRHARAGGALFDHMDVVPHGAPRVPAGAGGGDFTAAEVGLVAAFAGDARALWLSGDSAQAIARGVSFRFSDLKRLI